MGELTWALQATKDLYNTVDYIAKNNRTAAIAVSECIQESAQHLKQFPRLGKPGRIAGTRELVVTQAPYVLIYTIENDEVVITRVMHQSQAWPPQE